MRFDAAQYADAVKALHQVSRDISRLFERFDILITPTTPAPPYPLGTITMMEQDFEKYCDTLFRHAVFTVPFNCSGQPAASIPIWRTNSGIPIGVQFIAGLGREDILLKLANDLDSVESFSRRFPPISN